MEVHDRSGDEGVIDLVSRGTFQETGMSGFKKQVALKIAFE